MDNQVEKTLVLDAITELRKDIGQIKTDVALIKNDLNKIEKELEEKVKTLGRDAFPNGDLSGHKVYHESVIEQRKNTVDIKKEVTAHLLKGVFWTALVGIFWASAYAIKEWMNK